jgi:4-diphosphocytidyl-2-C-methyl-D-erythritol kinase
VTAELSDQLSDLAPAKINLTLRVLGRRTDGYHELCSLVCFASSGDALQLSAAPALSLSVDGETAAQSGDIADNLVLKAARALQAQMPEVKLGAFHLTKRLPVAAGLGGGSADAAAALRLLARLNELAPEDWRLTNSARATGADVPVCLDPRPRLMRGIGELLSAPIALPTLHALLVNPRVAVPTAKVFAALVRYSADDADPVAGWADADAIPKADEFFAALAQSGNDLEAPATGLFPVIDEVLASLRATGGCRLARMSGSGGTCFGLYDSADAASAAGTQLGSRHPRWWIERTTLASSLGA